MNDHDAKIALNLTSGIGPARAALLMEAFGGAAAVFDRSAEELSRVRGISCPLAEALLKNAGAPLEEELSRIERSGVRVLTEEETDYPPALRRIEDPPLCLYVCGCVPDPEGTHSLALVGSRRATSYGIRMARHLSESAVYAGWTVVSGLAVGIDAVAHQAAVEAKGKTVAVLGGGLMNIQPKQHVDLARSIVENGGGILTEFPMLFNPTRHSFPMRNRIISALSSATVVVEAGMHSGALITAAAALEQGKQVYAVPGNADSEMSMGCNDLIRNGNAALLTGFEDILSGSEFLPGFELAEPAAEGPSASLDAEEELLSETDRQVLEYLKTNGETAFDALSAGTGISADKLSRKLIALEIAHRIIRSSGGTYRIFR